MYCSSSKPDTFDEDETSLDYPLVVANGNGCNPKSSNLDNAYMVYHGQHRSLAGDDSDCGPRDHGITCQFDE